MSLHDKDLVGPVQKAIWALLTSASFTYTKADGSTGTVKAYDSPPKDTQPPFVAFGEPTVVPYRTKVKTGARVTFPIACVTSYAGLKEASALAVQVASILAPARLDVADDGLVVVTFRQLGSESAKLDDVLAARILRYEALVMEAQPQGTAS